MNIFPKKDSIKKNKMLHDKLVFGHNLRIILSSHILKQGKLTHFKLSEV